MKLKAPISERSARIYEYILVLLIGFITFLVASLSSKPCVASDYLYTGAYSQHLIAGEFNESHNLLGYQRNNVGMYYFINSYNDDSLALTYSYPVWENGTLQLNALVGITYGYRTCYGWKDANKTVCPYVSPELVFTKYKLQPAFGFLAQAVVISFRWEL